MVGTCVTCGASLIVAMVASMSRVLNSASRMGVEHRAEPFGIGRHRARPFRRSAFTFFSTTSQIMAAMSGPPNSPICLMPVGEVTLISVR